MSRLLGKLGLTFKKTPTGVSGIKSEDTDVTADSAVSSSHQPDGGISESNCYDREAWQDGWAAKILAAKCHLFLVRTDERLRTRILRAYFAVWVREALSLPSSPCSSTGSCTVFSDAEDAAQDPVPPERKQTATERAALPPSALCFSNPRADGAGALTVQSAATESCQLLLPQVELTAASLQPLPLCFPAVVATRETHADAAAADTAAAAAAAAAANSPTPSPPRAVPTPPTAEQRRRPPGQPTSAGAAASAAAAAFTGGRRRAPAHADDSDAGLWRRQQR
jgi:hypothetical protein